MRFEQSIEINATQQRVWDVLWDLEAWPHTVTTVEDLEILTPPPLATGSRIRMKQPKLPQSVYTVTEWAPPSFFELQQKASGATTVAGHRVESLGPDRARLSLTLDLSGLLIPIVGRVYGNLIRDYLRRESEGMKRAAESSPG